MRPAARDLAPGDVVAFADGSAAGHVGHRAVSFREAGLVTRDDDNRLTDARPLAPKQVIGRVELIDEGGTRRPVLGGAQGLWRARLVRAARRLRAPLRPLYRALRRWQVLRPLLGGWLQGRLSTVRLESPEGSLVKTLHRWRTISCRWPEQRRIECRKPHDLLSPHPDT